MSDEEAITLPAEKKTKELSCGVIYMNEKTGRFLVCHETLGRFWSLPKGVMDAGDRDMACAACRELREETGIVLEPHDL